MEYCLANARQKGNPIIYIPGATKQKAWLSDQSFMKNYSFEVVDATNHGYELLALSFDGTAPKFVKNVKKQKIESKELAIYYDM